VSRTPALNLRDPRQSPATIAAALHTRLSGQRGVHAVVVRPDGGVLEFRGCRLREADRPHVLGQFSHATPRAALEAKLAGAQQTLARRSA
jgi:hypothetical protein